MLSFGAKDRKLKNIQMHAPKKWPEWNQSPPPLLDVSKAETAQGAGGRRVAAG